MLNRRQLRIKILQLLYAFFQSKKEDYYPGEKELLHSISKMYEMYILFILIFSELKNIAENKILDNPNKHKEHNTFTNNKFILKLSNNSSIKKTVERLNISWIGDIEHDLIKKLFRYLITTDSYKAILNNTDDNFETHKQLCINIFKEEICNFNLLHNYFEENSIYWLDDIDHICSMILKTFKKITEDNNTKMLPLWKEDEKEFVLKLFKSNIDNNIYNNKLLTSYTKNWDKDRLAKMDLILMKMAICEAKEFSSIPLKVTLNEYIEISKFYSTPKSNGFINGVLDKVFHDLNKKGEIPKTGRGLI